jgi:hypothetical protein
MLCCVVLGGGARLPAGEKRPAGMHSALSPQSVPLPTRPIISRYAYMAQSSHARLCVSVKVGTCTDFNRQRTWMHIDESFHD